MMASSAMRVLSDDEVHFVSGGDSMGGGVTVTAPRYVAPAGYIVLRDNATVRFDSEKKSVESNANLTVIGGVLNGTVDTTMSVSGASTSVTTTVGPGTVLNPTTGHVLPDTITAPSRNGGRLDIP